MSENLIYEILKLRLLKHLLHHKLTSNVNILLYFIYDGCMNFLFIKRESHRNRTVIISKSPRIKLIKNLSDCWRLVDI